VDDQVGTVLCGHKIKGSEEAYFDRKDLDSLRNEYAKVDWKREKTVTVTEVSKLREELEQQRAKLKEFEQLLAKVAEEEQRPVSRE
jgi:capsule polysaccharide export protein KpsE/RkpR